MEQSQIIDLVVSEQGAQTFENNQAGFDAESLSELFRKMLARQWVVTKSKTRSQLMCLHVMCYSVAFHLQRCQADTCTTYLNRESIASHVSTSTVNAFLIWYLLFCKQLE